MRQLTFRGPGKLQWEDVVAPRLTGEGDSAGAALVRPLAVATCDLDAAMVSGAAPLPGPFAFGHEFVAEVAEVADGVGSVCPGDRVIVPFQVSCGTCERCRRGLTGSCATAGAGAAFGMAPIARRDWGGALSDLVLVPFADAMLVPLPPGADPATFASVSDNVPDGWRSVAPARASDPGAPVLVVGGSGDVALYAAAVAVALGSPHVDYVDTDERRLRVAESVGANPAVFDLENPIDRQRLSNPMRALGALEGMFAEGVEQSVKDAVYAAAKLFQTRKRATLIALAFPDTATFRDYVGGIQKALDRLRGSSDAR